ncbi:MAG: hypothetical protein ABII94_00430, partial [Patescibacteria group bacterium]
VKKVFLLGFALQVFGRGGGVSHPARGQKFSPQTPPIFVRSLFICHRRADELASNYSQFSSDLL